MITVLATREGLLGQRMSTGVHIHRDIPFVALPSDAALRQWVRVRRHDLTVLALVLDVGPWNEHDHAYVFQPSTLSRLGVTISTEIRPQAESGVDLFGRTTNKAGIDLGEYVWKALGMTDNDDVSWEFL